ncbi:MAG: threonine synthase [Bacteroidia bacterium]|nr:threonine synthase [Bacteroidia bacterium]
MQHPTIIRTLFSHLRCSKYGDFYAKDKVQTYSNADKPLWACYELEEYPIMDLLDSSYEGMWRYRKLLPVEWDENIVSLGEGGSPLIPLEKELFLKDEAANPTGSFKARGLSMAISKAKELGITKCVIPTAGNAGGAMSAYCAKAGMEANVYMPRETPKTFAKECEFFGAKVKLIDGNIGDCAAQIKADGLEDCFDVSTLKEPYRLEGKKTMGYEIAEQLNWKIPDVIVYPTGGGTGLIGIWKAFEEMMQLGWVAGEMPRMVAVQSEACYPIVKAFEAGESQAKRFEDPGLSLANGLRVPTAFGDELILNILYKSNGKAVKIPEQDIESSIHQFAQKYGILLSPEGAAVYKAYQNLLADRWITKDMCVVLLNTGTIYKYMENFV